MLEIIQLNHILTNTSNAEKSTIVQHENVALYHDLATQRMNKRAGKKRTTLQNTKKFEKLKVNEKRRNMIDGLCNKKTIILILTVIS